jgi:hypothetical protein
MWTISKVLYFFKSFLGIKNFEETWCTSSDSKEVEYKRKDSLFMVSKKKLKLWFWLIQEGIKNHQKQIQNWKIYGPQK